MATSRVIVAGSHVASKPQEANEVKILKALLKRTDDAEWASCISRAPRRLSTDEQQTLLRLLKKLGLEVDEAERLALDKGATRQKLHCVRCHKDYLEKANGIDACTIEHIYCDGEGVYVGPDVLEYTCETCGVIGVEDGSGTGVDWRERICYKGPHTTDEDDVDYDGDNTLTCESYGCHLGKGRSGQ